MQDFVSVMPANSEEDVLSLQLRQVDGQQALTAKLESDMLHRQRCNLDGEHALDGGQQDGVYGKTRSQPDGRTVGSVDERVALAIRHRCEQHWLFEFVSRYVLEVVFVDPGLLIEKCQQVCCVQ
jgi:hypothetical protein